jgi:hypothetical protein
MISELAALFLDKKAARLVDYIFIDERRLISYAEQLNAGRTVDKLPSWNVSLSLTGPKVDGKQDAKFRDATRHEMISSLISFLQKQDQLETGRPNGRSEYQFVLEETDVRKIILPIKRPRVTKGLTDIAVWFAFPPGRPIPRTEENMNEPLGTFLYLIEAYWESDERASGPSSGFSALNKMLYGMSDALGLDGKILSKYDARSCYKSPLTILQEIGGAVQPPRRIRTLYRKRYLSDDQYVEIQGTVHRSHDLFGYPIFVAAV